MNAAQRSQMMREIAARSRGLTFGKGNLRATITGILADPNATLALAAAIAEGMQAEVARLGRIVRAATPVSDGRAAASGNGINPPPGTLRKAVDAYGTVTKDGRGYVIMVRADAATRKPTPGDSKRSAASIAAFHAREGKRLQRALQKGKKFRPGKLNPKKGGRRYGPVPYGIFVDNETGFLTDTVTEAMPDVIRGINAAVIAHANKLNAGSGLHPKAS